MVGDPIRSDPKKSVHPSPSSSFKFVVQFVIQFFRSGEAEWQKRTHIQHPTNHPFISIVVHFDLKNSEKNILYAKNTTWYVTIDDLHIYNIIKNAQKTAECVCVCNGFMNFVWKFFFLFSFFLSFDCSFYWKFGSLFFY